MFWFRITLAAVATTVITSSAAAQRIAPAGVVRAQIERPVSGYAATDTMHSLPHHMKRGAMWGGITAGALTSLGLFWFTRGNQCEDCRPVDWSFMKTAKVVAVATAGGAAAGTLLGIAYHFNPEPTTTPSGSRRADRFAWPVAPESTSR